MITTRQVQAGRLIGDPATADLARSCVDHAARLLLSLQREDGTWQDSQDASLDAVSQHLLVQDMLGVRATQATHTAAALIRASQRRDGGWGGRPADPPDAAVTLQCYIALRLAGDGCDAYHMALAAGWIRDAGGPALAGPVARVWLAISGAAGWDRLRPDRPVAAPLPCGAVAADGEPGRPGALGRPGWPGWPGWPAVAEWLAGAGAVAMPLAVIESVRAACPRSSFDLAELAPPDACGVEPRGLRWSGAGADTVVGFALWCAQALAWSRPSRATAMRGCAKWLLARQKEDGSWGGELLPSALSLIALRRLGYAQDEPAIERGLAWLGGLAWPSSPSDMGAGSPGQVAAQCVAARPAGWSSALAVAALTVVGLDRSHPALARAARDARLADQQRQQRQQRPPPPLLPPAPGRSPGESHGREMSALATAEALAALSRAGLADGKRARRLLTWLLAAQREDGSWGGERGWTAAVVTAAVARALMAAGVRRSKLPIRRAVGFVANRQESDGHWRSGVSSDRDCTVVGTAVAVRALVGAAAEEAVVSAERGVRWLVGRQRGDGGWAWDGGPPDAGLAVPDHGSGPRLCDLCYPMLALGEYLSNTA